MLVVTSELTDRILDIEIENLASRLRPYQARPGNPSGVHLREFGRATAFVATELPVRFFNSVLGVGSETVDDLDDIVEFYATHNVSPAFEIVPGRLTEALGFELARHDFAMVEFHAGLARPLSPVDESLLDETVERIDPTDEAAFECFLDTYLLGWNGPGDHERAKQNMREWSVNDTWTFMLMRVDGTPAAAAILDVRGDTAILGSASTVDTYRGRGLQRALLDHRIGLAAQRGATLLVGGAYADTISMRNQQRAGLFTAFTRGIWARPSALP